MKKTYPLFVSILCLVMLVGCGYSTKSLLPSRLQTVYVDHFENKINFSSERRRNIYLPLLEVDIREAVTDRYLFDGNLKIANEAQADLVLKGELIGYERDPLRYTDNDDVEEYRIHIVVNLVLLDTARDEVYWEEQGFVGETTYFVTGSLAKSEADAVDDAIVDLARRIVERTIENW